MTHSVKTNEKWAQGGFNIWQVDLRGGSCCHSSGPSLVPRVSNPPRQVPFEHFMLNVMTLQLYHFDSSATSWTGSCTVSWVSGISPLWRVSTKKALPTICTGEKLQFCLHHRSHPHHNHHGHHDLHLGKGWSPYWPFSLSLTLAPEPSMTCAT